MKHIHLNVLEDVLIIGGVTISLPQIETILGIVILSFQILLILWKKGKRIYKAIKNKKPEEVTDALNDAKGELEHLKEETNGRKQD